MDHTTRHEIFSGFFWKFSEQIFSQFISLIISIALARLLLPSEYGIVALILVFINIANVFVTSGLSSALIQKKDANEVDFSTIFYCSVIVSVIVYGILFLLAPLIADFYRFPDLTLYLRVFAINILIMAYNSIQHAYVSRNMIFKKSFFSTIIGVVVSGLLGITMAYYGLGVWALICQYLMKSLMDTVVLSYIVPWRPRRLFSMSSANSLFGFGWKVLATDLLGTLFDNLRSLLIGKFYTSSDLAFYNRGQQFPSLIANNINTALSTVLFPAMSNVNNDILKVKEMTRRAIKTSTYIVFPFMAFLIADARVLITFLLTDKWLNSVIFLQILCISEAVGTISRIHLQALKAIGRSDVTLKLELIKKPLFLIILLASLQYGVLAIAVSMTIYSVIATMLNMWPNRNLLSYDLMEQITDIVPSALTSAIMGILIFHLNHLEINLLFLIILQACVGICTYVMLSVIFKVDSLFYLISRLSNIKKG